MYRYIIVNQEKLRKLIDRLYVSPKYENLLEIRHMLNGCKDASEEIESAYIAGNAQSHFREDFEELVDVYLKNAKESYDKRD